MKPIPNVVGFDLETPRGLNRLKQALIPYRNYESVESEIRRVNRQLYAARTEDKSEA